MLYNKQYISNKMKSINQVDKLVNSKYKIKNMILILYKDNYIENKKN